MPESAELMRLAIDAARAGLYLGQSPFGCAIGRDGEVLGVAHNSVCMDSDCTAHAEINAVRMACKKLHDVHLSGSIVATTCEPCPMCLAALHWAKVDVIYFGSSIADAAGAGFNEMRISATELARLSGSNLRLVPKFMERECRELFADWLKNPSRRAY